MQKKYIPVALLFALLLVFFAHFGARMNAVPTFTYADEQKKVYLTFDDGPSTRVTSAVLDVLKQENVKATFFIVSDRVAGREGVLKRIAAEGHTLGVHSKTHVYSQIYASDKAFLADVEACEKVIREVAGVTPRVYRFPGGGCLGSARRSKLLAARGYRVVRWNAVCGDEEMKNASADALAEKAKETSRGKANVVLLLHDSAPHGATAEALPAIIGYFRGQGYEFCAY